MSGIELLLKVLADASKEKSDRDKGTLSCNQCDLKFKTNDTLKIHKLGVHEGTKFPCVKCDYEAARKSCLRKHVKRMHEKNKLSVHSDDDDRFQCQKCNFKTSQKPDLQLHIRAVHEGVKHDYNQCEVKAT